MERSARNLDQQAIHPEPLQFETRAAHTGYASHPPRNLPAEEINILPLLLIHPKMVPQFMDDRQADLFADFGLAGADCFNILLIKNNVIGSIWQVEYAFLGGGHTMKDAQKQPPLVPRLG